jgi:hypothetical protein
MNNEQEVTRKEAVIVSSINRLQGLRKATNISDTTADLWAESLTREVANTKQEW